MQEPANIGADDNNRAQFSCNFNATAAYPADKLEEEIIKLLYDNSLSNGIGNDTFVGIDAVMPKTGPGPFTIIVRTAGFPPMETHNGDKYQRLTFQIVVRAVSYVVARTRAIAIWRLLDGQRDVTLTAA